MPRGRAGQKGWITVDPEMILVFMCKPHVKLWDMYGGRMRILHICETVKGGTATYLNELIPLLQKKARDSHVTLLMPREQASEVPDIAPETLVFFSRPSRLSGAFHLLVGTFRALLRDRPDIVHAHSTFAGFASRVLGPFFKAKVVYCPHGWAMDREQPNFLRHIYAWIERRLGKLTARVVAVSEHERQRGIRAGISPMKITAVYNGLRVDIPAYEPLSWDDRRLKVLFVGRLDRDKGVDVLLNATRSLGHKVVVRVIGGAVIEGLGFDFCSYPQAEFLGWLDAVSILPHMAACDAVVVPSRWEGFGYVAAEAMRMGKAVIASRVGGLTELVVDKETGFLFPSEDSKALAEILDQAQKERLFEMGEKGRERFLRHFTASRMAEEILRVYEEI